MIIKIVVDFSTSMRVCSKCHCMLMSQQVLICSVKPSLARRLCFFFCPLKIVKSVWFEISLLTVQTLFHYYTYCQVTTQQPSSRHYDREKGVLLWLLAFHLKTTEINWILKYFTCSPSTCNSHFSQNNGQVGSLQELIQKVERTGQR